MRLDYSFMQCCSHYCYLYNDNCAFQWLHSRSVTPYIHAWIRMNELKIGWVGLGCASPVFFWHLNSFISLYFLVLQYFRWYSVRDFRTTKDLNPGRCEEDLQEIGTQISPGQEPRQSRSSWEGKCNRSTTNTPATYQFFNQQRRGDSQSSHTSAL